MVIKGLVLAFRWATTLSSLNVKGDPTELREEAIWYKDQLESLQYQDNNDQHFEAG